MVHVDWGELQHTGGQRRYVEARIAACPVLNGLSVALAQHGCEVEARLRLARTDGVTELRVRDSDVCRLVDRVLVLLAIVAAPSG